MNKFIQATMIKKWNKLAKSFCVILSVFTLASCSQVLDKHIEWEYEEPKSYPIIRAIGYAPISLQNGSTQGQKVLMALRSSKLDAYRELAEQVYGQQISSKSNVQGMITNNDQLKARVNGMVKGAKIVKSYAVGDTYATELELDMKKVYDIYKVETKNKRVKRVMYY